MSTPGDADDESTDEQLHEALRFLSHDAREGHSSTLALLELQRVRAETMALGELAQRIESNVRRSLMRIDDFVAYARARSQPLQIEEVDLLELLLDAVAEAWHAGNERGLRLQVGDVPPVAPLQADRSLLSAAISKLLRRALEQSRPGSALVCSVRELSQAWSLEVDEVPNLAPHGAASAAASAVARVAEGGHAWALVELVARRLGGSARECQEPNEPGMGMRLRVTFPRA